MDDVSLSIKEHEFVAIIGQSGSGKSTFMNMLGCLDRPDSGEITLDGTDILKCKEKELSVIRNKKIGFIFQQFHLLPKLSALENVELPLIYQGMPTKKRREKAAKDLFGHTDVEGETIRISGRNFKIIGVLEEDGSSQRDSNDSVIYIPFTTAQRIMQNSTISSFYVSAVNEGMLNMAESAVDSFLLEKTGDEDSYTITNQSDIADSVSDVTNSMTYMIGGIAGISLLVGGIGIMNIMLVSVTERIKEIGIRKAIGAKKKDILAQFMIESTVLLCMGGVIGIALSAATIFGMNQFMSADYTISAGISLVALGFSAVLGIVFGLYPANKAANLKPIEALNL